MANEELEKVAKINQSYLNDFLQYLSYMIDKGEVDEAEMKFQDNMRRLKKNK